MSEPGNVRLFPPYNHTRGDSELEPCAECNQILVETEGGFPLIDFYHAQVLENLTKLRGHMEVFAKRRKIKVDLSNMPVTELIKLVYVWKAVRE